MGDGVTLGHEFELCITPKKQGVAALDHNL